MTNTITPEAAAVLASDGYVWVAVPGDACPTPTSCPKSTRQMCRWGGIHPPAELVEAMKPIGPFITDVELPPTKGRISTRATLDLLMAVETDGCVLWPHSVNRGGYGQVNYHGKNDRAHKVACELAHGPRPSPDMEVCHSCDNRRCVNPRHLRWGTRVENMQERDQRGRTLKGTDQWQAKLTPGNVREIRRLLKTGSSQQVIADQFNVGRGAVQDIHKGKNWAWLDSPAQSRNGKRVIEVWVPHLHGMTQRLAMGRGVACSKCGPDGTIPASVTVAECLPIWDWNDLSVPHPSVVRYVVVHVPGVPGVHLWSDDKWTDITVHGDPTPGMFAVKFEAVSL